MSRSKKLTVKFFANAVRDGEVRTVPVEELTEEELAELRQKVTRALTDGLDEILPNNYEWAMKLCKKGIIHD